MAKIMLVEDDNNLREIYEARLLAEGHEIISAHDGEEALAMAVREKPELIISDVMMPKISGFDMLDILRGSPETQNTKVIMMTALSQLEDKDRAEKLGADRYLVKSQVTLEDVIRVAREVLEGDGSSELTVPEPLAPISGTSDGPVPLTPAPDMPVVAPPASDDSADTTQATPVAEPSAAPQTAQADDTSSDNTTNDTTTTTDQVDAASVEPALSPVPEPEAPADNPAVPTVETVQTEPLQEPTAANEPAASPAPDQDNPAADAAEPEVTESSDKDKPVDSEEQIANAQTTDSEKSVVEGQIENFINNELEAPPINIADDGSMSVEASEPPKATEANSQTPDNQPVSLPDQPQDTAQTTETPAEPVQPVASDSIPEPATVTAAAEPVETEDEQPSAQATPSAEQTPEADTANIEAPGEQPPSQAKKVIQPLHDPTEQPDINALLEKEQEKQEIDEIVQGVNQPPVQGTITPDAAADSEKPQDPGAIAL